MTPLRIAAWNMKWQRRGPGGNEAGWNYLVDSVSPGIALLQEAHPNLPEDRQVFRPIDEPGTGRYWGSAVALLNDELVLARIYERVPITPFLPEGQLEQSHPGATAVAVVRLPSGEELTAVSIYGLLERASNGTTYSITTLHRSLSDLTGIIDTHRNRGLVVLGGDLNASTQMPHPDREAHKALFQRIRALGLVDCLERTRDERQRLDDCMCGEPDSCSHVRTYRHRGSPSSKPWQDDYLFASPPLAERLLSCRVLDEEQAWSHSDHCPVVAEFETATP